MASLERIVSRRSFVGLAGVLAVAAGVPTFLGLRSRWPGSPCEIVFRWPLQIGGEGLFLAAKANPGGADLEGIGNWLRQTFRDRPNVVAQIFDDATAARVVRKGSRIVSEAEFSAAMSRQRASYTKRAATGHHFLTILSDPPRVIQY